MYYIITADEKGEASVTVLAQEIAEKRISEKYWGDIEWVESLDDNSMYWGKQGMIVKGSAVLPKIVATAFSTELP